MFVTKRKVRKILAELIQDAHNRRVKIRSEKPKDSQIALAKQDTIEAICCTVESKLNL